MGSRLAVGILASMAPHILEQTVAHWLPEFCSVYVHVDTKYDAEAFSFLAGFPSVTLIEERHRVMWGGFSMVEAEISLMRAALDDGFDHFIFISDDTVPLLPLTRMLALLDAPESWSMLGKVENRDVIARYEGFYCLDINASNPRNRSLTYEPGEMDLLLELYMLGKSGKFPLKGLYWSANWKALPREDVEFVVRSHRNGGHMTQSFKFSINSDEHYMQTLLGHRPSGARYVSKFIWADFRKDPKPYVMTVLEDFEEPLGEGYWFARKVHDPEIARAMLARIGGEQPVGSSNNG
jgi:hypothetical protein